MKIFILFFTLLVSFCGYSQEKSTFVNKKVDDFIMNLNLKGIDKIIISDTYTKTTDAYSDNCLDSYFKKVDSTSVTNFSDYLIYYVLWTNRDKAFVKKFDFCTEYEVISFSNKELIFRVNNANLNRIYKEEILANQFIKDDVVIYNMVTCGTPREIFFCSQNFKFSKRIDYNDLSIENNMNYEHNRDLDTIKLDQLVTDAIRQLDIDGNFLSE